MADKVTRFLGDTPGRTAVKLIVISLIVGIIMSALNFTPWDIWHAITNFFHRLYELGFRAFGRFGEYLLYGAMVVIPVFVLFRVVNYRESR